MKPNGTRRERGAYYTPPAVAQMLANWGVRSPTDIVLDPAAGKGALLIAAHARLQSLGAAPGAQLFGAELHTRTHAQLLRVGRELDIPSRNLVRGDLFKIHTHIPATDVVLMNPPYVRHHSIPPRARKRMKECVQEAGVTLSGRASSWAYFLLQCTTMLKCGGRIAALLPRDILGASYGRDVLGALDARFASTSIDERWDDVFPELQLRVVVLYADGYRGAKPPHGAIGTTSVLRCVPAVKGREGSSGSLAAWRGIAAGRSSIAQEIEHFVAERRASGLLMELSSLAEVRIGYVSGDSDFFHLTETQRRALGFGLRDVVPTVARGRLVDGINFTETDWRGHRCDDVRCWLLHPQERSAAVSRYIRTKRGAAALSHVKCRARRPRWRVELSEKPDALIVYSGWRPRIVNNEASVWASNAMYLVRAKDRIRGRDLAVGALTSVSQAWLALTGRELGGGLRKLDVADVQQLPLPVAHATAVEIEEIDRLVRSGGWHSAVRLADRALLDREAGWSRKEIVEIQRLYSAYVSDDLRGKRTDTANERS